MDTIVLTIDGVEVKTRKGKRILEAALDAGIYIPNLCALRDIKLPFGACRLCQVKIEGRAGLVTACSEPVADGMVVHSNTPEVNSIRRKVLEIMLVRHPHACLTCWRKERCQPFHICLRNVAVSERCITCPKNGRCELQKAVDLIGLDGMPFPYTPKGHRVERDNPFIVRDNNLCILCGRCVRVCQEILGIEAIAFNFRGAKTVISGAFGKPLIESGCTFCGCCVEVCPVGALIDRGDEWNRWTDRRAALIRCRHACPVNVDVPRFIRFIREADYSAAVMVIREQMPFASICSLICEHPCETACRRGELDQPVAIRALERFTVERAGHSKSSEDLKAKASGKKVAVIGSGPAGLTAAYYLTKKAGHMVTVFERLHEIGGMMRTVIPEYILPRQVLDTEIESLRGLGIEIKTDHKAESLDKLFDDGYDAIFLAIGGTSEIPEQFGIAVTDENTIGVDLESLMTNRKGVFAGGTAVTGRVSFIEAVAAGRKAAVSIDRYLGGDGDISEIIAPRSEAIPKIGPIYNFAQRKRQEMPLQLAPSPMGNLDKVELGFTDDLANEEARRCMGCDLRFAVRSMVDGNEHKSAKRMA